MDQNFDWQLKIINSSYFEFQKNPERSFSEKSYKNFWQALFKLDIKENFKKYASSAQNIK